ncbi:GNAT family N-acetyltransferase [Vibrio sp. 99-8-1]|uniref:GNAT family N-acetyltransferase n=1 Tax=Vibrio sp. 99-8-1 TaxID=2607602 RepID=UPI00149377E2|nr:GNAT family N-acetyltransferase [Vibrio sp. 99-8-1]
MIVTANLIEQSDTSELLAFELKNRKWFEKQIPPRLESFYSLAGVQSQIQEFLDLYEQEAMVPMLLRTEQGQICGRLNLHINKTQSNTGVIGYRIGEAYTRQGVATQAVKLIQEYIVEYTEVTELRAIALTTNLGSIKVLEKSGFKPLEFIKNYALLNGRHVDANEYVWNVASEK